MFLDEKLASLLIEIRWHLARLVDASHLSGNNVVKVATFATKQRWHACARWGDDHDLLPVALAARSLLPAEREELAD